MSKWRWLLLSNRHNGARSISCLEWHVSCHHLVDHHAKAEDVCSKVHRLALSLLWRHITDCSHYSCIRVRPVDRCRGVGLFNRLLLSQFSQAEIQHFDIAVPPEHHVLGLD